MTELNPTSTVDGLDWPALPGRKVRALMSVLFQLDRSQWLAPQRIRDNQFRQLARLLAHARATVPFYRDRLAKAEGPLSAGQWTRIPVLRRRDVQDAGTALHSSRVPAGHGRVSPIFTSGSTGRPVRALRSELTALFWEAFTLRDHLWHDHDPTRKLAAIRSAKKGSAPYPDGAPGSWSPGSEALFGPGPAVSLNINCTVAEQVDWLRRQDPDYLLTFPSNLRRLAEHCLAEGIRPKSLRQVQTISEVLEPGIRKLCREAWGVPVTDIYSSREVGYLALQCPECEHLHVQSEGVLLEVLDDKGRACGPGEVGKVVVTPLHNFAMPLLRYEIGDYAEVGEDCRCGRGLAVLRRILGRVQNMLVLPSGERRWTLLGSDSIGAFLDIAPIRQYQFVQKSLQTLEVRLVVERPPTADEENRLREWTLGTFDHPFAVTFSYHDEIARTASGKYQDFVSEV